MLAILNVYRCLLSDVFGDEGLISRFKHSKFGVDIRHKYNEKCYVKYCFYVNSYEYCQKPKFEVKSDNVHKNLYWRNKFVKNTTKNFTWNTASMSTITNIVKNRNLRINLTMYTKICTKETNSSKIQGIKALPCLT